MRDLGRYHKLIIKSRRTKRRRLRSVDGLDSFEAEFRQLRATVPSWQELYEPHVSDKIRLESWMRIDVIGQHLCQKYAWAVPDERTLQIIRHFQPIVEIGAGKGYWAKLLRDRNTDIIAVDKYLCDKTWTEVIEGDSKILCDASMAGRTLLLCYPDENEPVSVNCLEHYTGEYVIHIGEMITTGGTISGPPQAPFGRTTSSDFQVELATQFHCLLVSPIQAFPFSRDTISIWKRTTYIEGLLTEDDNSAEEVSDSNESDDDANLWASIPADEVLPVARVAPCLAHLLA